MQLCSNPIFIIGAPRSGTSILAWSLGQHSQLWTGGESDILYRLFGDDRAEAAFELATGRPQGLLRAQGVERAEFLASLGAGINALFTGRSGGRRWIDQTPSYTLMVDVLLDIFPGAVFLHILRDGRRVVNSMVASGFGEPWAADFRTACRTWRDFVEIGMSSCEEHPSRCRGVVNEALIESPEEGFGEIFRFLGIPHEDGPATFFRSRRINSSYGPDDFQGCPSPELPEPWNAWSAVQKRTFGEEAAGPLVRCGFATEEGLRRSGWLITTTRGGEVAGRDVGPARSRVAARDAIIRDLQSQLAEQSAWARRTAEEVAARDAVIRGLQARLDRIHASFPARLYRGGRRLLFPGPGRQRPGQQPAAVPAMPLPPVALR